MHIPYIVGFIDNLISSFQHFTGVDCVKKFIIHLFSYRKESKIFINAFNGSKFDHYEFVKRLNKMYSERNDTDDGSFKLDKLVLNNGAILKAAVGNIDCFDISKHITGTLRQNLKEMGCVVQKGDFDYSGGDEWDKMSDVDQASCLPYLEGDVLGLKELTELLNQSCFEKFGVNLYKYMS